jgi:hypothetical protein
MEGILIVKNRWEGQREGTSEVGEEAFSCGFH